MRRHPAALRQFFFQQRNYGKTAAQSEQSYFEKHKTDSCK
jgi:hypothetical protein